MSRKTDVGQYADPQGTILQKAGVGILFAAGTTVPTDAAAGYAPGCIFQDTDASADAVLFVNQGTATSCNFDALVPVAGTVSALTITTLTNTTQTRSAAAALDTYIANTALALSVTDGTTTMYAIDTRNTIKDVSAHVFRAAATTIATEAAAHANPVVEIPARTITYTGTNTVTSQMGALLRVGALTLTDTGAGTVTKASPVHIVAMAAAGGSLTITASHMITTSVTDCLLTNAGVWTDMACWESGKEKVARGVEAASDAVMKVLDKIKPATWQYKAETALPAFNDETGESYIHRTAVNDRGRERVGIIYDDLPEELRAPGEATAVSTGVLSSFALAALKVMSDRIEALEARLAAQ